jgi:hypothetical protein
VIAVRCSCGYAWLTGFIKSICVPQMVEHWRDGHRVRLCNPAERGRIIAEAVRIAAREQGREHQASR